MASDPTVPDGVGQPPTPIRAAHPVDAPVLATTKIEFWGVKLEVPFPAWAVASLAVLLIVAAAASAIWFSASKITKTVLVPKEQMEVYEESAFHATEPQSLKEVRTETFANQTTVTVSHFLSDECVQIVRYDPVHARGDGLWMFGPTPHTALHNHEVGSSIAPTLGAGGTRTASYRSENSQPAKDNLDSTQAQLVLVQDQLKPGPDKFQPVQGGRCINPHPGAFTAANEPVNQCIVKVWRTFYDGCMHYQFYNACTNTWDVFPDGSPHVYWTRCLH